MSWPGVVSSTWSPAPRSSVGLRAGSDGSHGRDRQRLQVLGVDRRAGDAHRHRLAVDRASRSERHVPGSCAGGGGSCRPGMPSSAIPTGVTTVLLVSTGRVCAPDRSTRSSPTMCLPVTAGKCTIDRNRRRSSARCTGSAGSGIQRTWPSTASLQQRRPRVALVGDDLEVHVIERDRLGELVARRTAAARRRTVSPTRSSGSPSIAAVGPALHAPGEELARLGVDAALRRGRHAERRRRSSRPSRRA